MVVAAPGFGLAVLGLGPATLHWWGYLLLWAACSGGIAAVVYHKLSKTGLGYASRYGTTRVGMLSYLKVSSQADSLLLVWV